MQKFTVWAPAPQPSPTKPQGLFTKNWAAAGQLEFGPGGCTFRYLDSWLESHWAYSLDPVHLPLAPVIYYPRAPTQLLPLFSHLLPSGWAAELQKTKLPTPQQQTPYAQFKSLPDGLNAIRLSPLDEPLKDLTLPNWDALENHCQRARQQAACDYPMAFYLAFMAGGCWQGAQPKLTLQGTEKLWLAKWQAIDATINWPQIEYASLELLKQTGLNVPQRHIIPTDQSGWIYLIERFDQSPDDPVYFISAEVLLGKPNKSACEVDARRDPGSYIALARCLRKYSSAAKADLHELYRRLLANLLLNNSQDQLHKFGLVYHIKSQKWRLAPCFGLRPSLAPTSHQALAIGTQGRLRSINNALSLAAEFALTLPQAKLMLAHLRDDLGNWRRVFDSCGVSGQDRQWLGRVIQLEDF